jgi:hypothetical protein
VQHDLVDLDAGSPHRLVFRRLVLQEDQRRQTCAELGRLTDPQRGG